MQNQKLYTVAAVLRILFVAVGLVSNRPVSAQGPESQAPVQNIIQAAAKNKQAPAQYTWVERISISLRGE